MVPDKSDVRKLCQLCDLRRQTLVNNTTEDPGRQIFRLKGDTRYATLVNTCKHLIFVHGYTTAATHHY